MAQSDVFRTSGLPIKHRMFCVIHADVSAERLVCVILQGLAIMCGHNICSCVQWG